MSEPLPLSDISHRDTAIARVSATPINVPLTLSLAGSQRSTNLSAVLCQVETRGGLIGNGFTSITDEEAVAPILSELVAPNVVGEDAMAHERLWDKLYWLLTPRGQTGYAAHAMAAFDIALWDIKGKALGRPIWRLLGGARARVPIYVTCGFPFLDREALVAVARDTVAQGHTRIKMTVAAEALARRDDPRPVADLIAEDARRVLAVREAVGPDIGLFVDANCNLDPYHAGRLADMIAPARIDLFEEPLTQNDIPAMADLRRRTGLALACGQNEGLAFRFRDMLTAGAVDMIQPNVTITGGFTQVLRIAGMAAAFNVPIANGGAWQFHNMHLHGGLAHGGLIEYHLPAAAFYAAVFDDIPKPDGPWLDLPDGPGLGFEPNRDAVAEFAGRPPARGRGKG